MALIECPECGKAASSSAASCPACGFPIRTTWGESPDREHPWHPGVAAVLSLVVPGAGQMYRRRITEGFAWLVGIVIGYAVLNVLGFPFHVWCVYNAASPQIRK